MSVVRLADASDEAAFGGKAASLARAIAAGLPVPDGFAVSWEGLEDRDAIVAAFHATGGRVAVRSSAIGEDSADASFAGQHATILNVANEAALLDAVQTIRDSARSDGAMAYRKHVGAPEEPRIAIVIQQMIDAEAAGVMFTRNPMTGASERVIESAWGLGEAVVSGLVTPDRFRVSASGEIVERKAGHQDVAIRFAPEGGTAEVRMDAPHPASGHPFPAARGEGLGVRGQLSLTDPQLMALHRLAAQVEKYFGGPQDVEWAVRDGELYLLQSRPITVEHRIEELTPRRFTGLALAALLAPLNSTIIAVALPSIATAFDASASVVTRWMVTSYLVVSIIAQSPAGKLADLLGTSRVLTLGRAMFGLGALFAAFAPALAVLGVGRVLMAIGGALSIPTVFAQLRNSVPPGRRGRVFGIFGAIMGGAAAAGPIIGGFLTARYGWHSVFVVNVPVVLLSFLLEPPRRTERATKIARFDFLGSGLLAVAVLLLVAAIERVPLLFVAALIAFAAFVYREQRASDPVLDVRLFTHTAFAAGSAIVALQNLAMYSMVYLIPFFLARDGAAKTGQMLLLFTASMVLMSPIGGRLSDAIGARIVTFSGAVIATAGASLFVMQGSLIASLIVMGAGIGIATSPSQAAALGAIAANQAGVASGALSTMRYLGGVIGGGLVALLATGEIAGDARLMIFPAVLAMSAIVALALPMKRSTH